MPSGVYVRGPRGPYKEKVSLLDRIAEKIDTYGPVPAHRPELGPCHLWLGSTNDRGYGQINHHEKRLYVHRVLNEARHGPLPKGVHVLHHCDTPACVRDEHHFRGTPLDNARDKQRKGRGNQPKGVKNRWAKMTDQKVEQLLDLYATGSWSAKALGRHFGISDRTAGYIIDGKIWKHVRRIHEVSKKKRRRFPNSV